MKNTWYPKIDTEALYALLGDYDRLTQSRPHSAVVTRHFDEFRASYIYNSTFAHPKTKSVLDITWQSGNELLNEGINTPSRQV